MAQIIIYFFWVYASYREEKIKSKNSLRQKPIEYWKQLEHILSYISQVN